jgi:hypothetical protein
MENDMTNCPDEDIQALVVLAQKSDEAGLTEIDRLLDAHPDDPRLYFLKGSLLAGVQRYVEGRGAMRTAIQIAPHYDLARFQLGFLELTSGMPDAAEETWQPFENLPTDAPFRLLSEGLICLGRDSFEDAERLLKLGMEGNADHPLINADMQLLLDEVANKIPQNHNPSQGVIDASSAVGQMLQQFELRGNQNRTRH